MKKSAFKYINLIGIELEGGWKNIKTSKDVIYKSDHSVEIRDYYYDHIGEINSIPLQFEQVESWIKSYCPDKVNKTCGLHVHVSFKNFSDYVRLMDNKFYDYFIECMVNWGKEQNFPANHLFWNRLKGKNNFCRKRWTPLGQIIDIEDRYTQLNFCFSEHGTLECRSFPAFDDPKIIYSSVCSLVNCYESYLSKSRKVTLENKLNNPFIEI